ncbi:hypothetical protein ParKJ_40725 [Paraburkholderia fungorum]|uniref:Uncharacterized protein n=1 Tax=Paraburkholderia fungorum TaxID=134537 RepID=A0AAP5QJF1_9BURK|nr:hypothetical protein [Paraburkholderia fungorum]MDT8843725.1 hypothetical protein [Paraburkholderia fungorum]
MKIIGVKNVINCNTWTFRFLAVAWIGPIQKLYCVADFIAQSIKPINIVIVDAVVNAAITNFIESKYNIRRVTAFR